VLGIEVNNFISVKFVEPSLQLALKRTQLLNAC